LAEKEAEIQQTIEQTISGLPETRFTQLEKLQHTASVGVDVSLCDCNIYIYIMYDILYNAYYTI